MRQVTEIVVRNGSDDGGFWREVELRSIGVIGVHSAKSNRSLADALRLLADALDDAYPGVVKP